MISENYLSSEDDLNGRDLTKPSDVVYEKCRLVWDI